MLIDVSAAVLGGAAVLADAGCSEALIILPVLAQTTRSARTPPRQGVVA